jgi:crossover junction endodeoxyribonuclease RusA
MTLEDLAFPPVGEIKTGGGEVVRSTPQSRANAGSVGGVLLDYPPALQITLPWPPSVNHYYRTPHSGPLAGRTMISREGRHYRERVSREIAAKGLQIGLRGRLYVEVNVYEPDRRKRDLDNVCKALFDSLSKAGMWVDDEQLDLILLRRCDVVPGGYVRLAVCELPQPQGALV